MNDGSPTLVELARVESLEQGCARLGELLGLDGPVQETVLRAALQDTTYAHNLFASRSAPAFLEKLLKSPPQSERVSGEVSDATGLSNAQLLARASSALWRWGRSGFERIDEQARARRIAACRSCPHLTEPSGALQLMASGRGDDLGGRVCGRCGCLAARKVAVPTESCPAPHPTVAGFTRWGEPAAEGLAGRFV